jgi:ornithine carbamoyltransferase
LGKHDAVKDVARNLSRWVDAILARVQSHQTVLELAENATVPVINGLTDFEHPCQALSDYLTLLECKGDLANVTLAWVGDGNNVAHSLIYGAARLGAHLRIATPPGYEPDRSVMADAKREGGDVTLMHDPAEAVVGADVVYTDVWTSMGMEHEAETRQEIFRPYQVNSSLMRQAGSQALFMHCQPARRGEEVTDEVMDSPRSLAYQQAENRLHMQKAIFLALLS